MSALKPGRLIRHLVVVTALGATIAPAASAGTYHVYSCRTPSGAVAPTDGWQPLSGSQANVIDNCAAESEGERGDLFVSSGIGGGAGYPGGLARGYRYDAPADTTFVRLTIARRMVVDNGNAERHMAAWLGVDSPSYADSFDRCAPGCTLKGYGGITGGEGVDSGPLTGARTLYALAGCPAASGATCAGDAESNVVVRGLDAEISDVEVPAADAVSGPLAATDRPHSGVEAVSFSAVDKGAGVYRSLVQIRRAGDATWTTANGQIVDSNNGRCAEFDAQTGIRNEFAHLVPCRLSVAETTSLDTTEYRDGAYDLRVLVEDAAGNVGTVVAERRIEIDNVPSPALLSPPTITGEARAGATLQGTRGAWRGGDLEYMHSWIRCAGADPSTCVAIPDATTTLYRLTSEDVGKRIRHVVTATDAGGTTTAASEPTGAVAAAPAAQPTNPSGFDDPVNATPGGGAPAGPAPSGPAAAAGRVNGVNASSRARLTLSGAGVRRIRHNRIGRTTLTLRDESGRPITGAKIVVVQRLSGPGEEFVATQAALTTDADGRVRYVIERGPGRTLRFAYSPVVGGQPTVVRDLLVKVPSRTTLRTNKSARRNGQSVRFLGRLRTRPVPPGGVVIDLQARVRGGWQSFRTVRTNAAGKWRARYKFRSTTGVQTYVFRARVRGDSAYPFLPSKSRRVKVVVRG